AGQKFRCNDLALNRAELHGLSLSLDRAQLARGIDFGLDAPARILLDRGGVVLGVLVQSVVERRKRYLHHIGFVVCRAWAKCHCQRQHENATDGCCPCHQSPSRDEHIESLSLSLAIGTSEELPSTIADRSSHTAALPCDVRRSGARSIMRPRHPKFVTPAPEKRLSDQRCRRPQTSVSTGHVKKPDLL